MGLREKRGPLLSSTRLFFSGREICENKGKAHINQQRKPPIKAPARGGKKNPRSEREHPIENSQSRGKGLPFSSAIAAGLTLHFHTIGKPSFDRQRSEARSQCQSAQSSYRCLGNSFNSRFFLTKFPREAPLSNLAREKKFSNTITMNLTTGQVVIGNFSDS